MTTQVSVGEIWKSTVTGQTYRVKDVAGFVVIMESVPPGSELLTTKENVRLFYEKKHENGLVSETDGQRPTEFGNTHQV